MFSSHVSAYALEDKYPGFLTAIGGDELRRARSAMTCMLVGGTIEALVATDAPPSLAKLSSLSKADAINVEAAKAAAAHDTSASRRTVANVPTPIIRDPAQVEQMELEHQASIHRQTLTDLGLLHNRQQRHSQAGLHHVQTVQGKHVPGEHAYRTPSAAQPHSGAAGRRSTDIHDSSASLAKTSVQSDSAQLHSSATSTSKSQVTDSPFVVPKVGSDGVSTSTAAAGGEAGSLAIAKDTAEDSAKSGQSSKVTSAAQQPPVSASQLHSRDSQGAGIPDDANGRTSLDLHLNMPTALVMNVNAIDHLAREGGPQARVAGDAADACGRVLQDLAARATPGSHDHVNKLQEACQMYSIASKLRPHNHSSLYNWGLALSDLATTMKKADPASAKLCWESADARYSEAAHNPDYMASALNNWGLNLQDLSTLAQNRVERDALLSQACAKFRQALRIRPDFDRACYNLGSVCYGAACTLQGELSQHPGAASHSNNRKVNSDNVTEFQGKKQEVEALFSASAQYICLAFAMLHDKDTYRKPLATVKKLLRLPFLRNGYLLAPMPNTRGTLEEAWRQDWFVLDSKSLRAATGAELSISAPGNRGTSSPTPSFPGNAPGAPIIPLADIASVHRLKDTSLPPGGAFCIALKGSQLCSNMEVIMIAEDDASAVVWVDVLMLAAHIVQTRGSAALADALNPTTPH